MRTNACSMCCNCIRQEESWEMPHIFWYECTLHPSWSNLKSFPFHHTQCKDFNQRKDVRHQLEQAVLTPGT